MMNGLWNLGMLDWDENILRYAVQVGRVEAYQIPDLYWTIKNDLRRNK